MSNFIWHPRGDNNIHILLLKHTGNGKYKSRLICKGLKEGDTVERQGKVFLCEKINLNEDAKGIWPDEEAKKLAYFECEFLDLAYKKNTQYVDIINIGYET